MDMDHIFDLCKPVADYLKTMGSHIEVKITDDCIKVMAVELSIPVKE